MMRRLVILLLVWLTALGLGRMLLMRRLGRSAGPGHATLDATVQPHSTDYAAGIAAASVLLLLAIVPPLVAAVIWKRKMKQS